MAALSRHYPPYEGEEPYLYFAFAEADSEKAGPLLAQLYARGCRVWYGSGKDRSHRLERVKNASLSVVYMSSKAMADADEVKSSALFCQSRGTPVVVIDVVENNELSTGFGADTQHIPALNNPEQLEAALIRTEGFTQSLIGEKRSTIKTPAWKIMLTGLLTAAVVGLGGAYAMGAFAPKDEVIFQNQVIRNAVRNSVGRPITEAAVQKLMVLHLTEVPEKLDELNCLPNLERIEIPEEAVPIFEALTEQYTIVVYGGNGND